MSKVSIINWTSRGEKNEKYDRMRVKIKTIVTKKSLKIRNGIEMK